jgi:hypothetical protein
MKWWALCFALFVFVWGDKCWLRQGSIVHSTYCKNSQCYSQDFTLQETGYYDVANCDSLQVSLYDYDKGEFYKGTLLYTCEEYVAAYISSYIEGVCVVKDGVDWESCINDLKSRAGENLFFVQPSIYCAALIAPDFCKTTHFLISVNGETICIPFTTDACKFVNDPRLELSRETISYVCSPENNCSITSPTTQTEIIKYDDGTTATIPAGTSYLICNGQKLLTLYVAGPDVPTEQVVEGLAEINTTSDTPSSGDSTADVNGTEEGVTDANQSGDGYYEDANTTTGDTTDDTVKETNTTTDTNTTDENSTDYGSVGGLVEEEVGKWLDFKIELFHCVDHVDASYPPVALFGGHVTVPDWRTMLVDLTDHIGPVIEPWCPAMVAISFAAGLLTFFARSV